MGSVPLPLGAFWHFPTLLQFSGVYRTIGAAESGTAPTSFRRLQGVIEQSLLLSTGMCPEPRKFQGKHLS